MYWGVEKARMSNEFKGGRSVSSVVITDHFPGVRKMVAYGAKTLLSLSGMKELGYGA